MKTSLPKIALYRILGNDLPPRHKTGQTYDNLKFTLAHEPNFPNCQKKWVVNRIFDSKMAQKIIKFLERYGQSYIHIPFDFQEYKNCRKKRGGDYGMVPVLNSELLRERYNKIRYVMNINGAKNAALRDGKQIADWILPFDGNCCFTEQGWKGVIKKLSIQKKADRCFVVPMFRLTNNNKYLNFNPKEHPEHEPQVIFGKYSKFKFNESYIYGQMNKIELLERLGFKRKITAYGFIITDPKYRCGYVIRLFSGVKEGEVESIKRFDLREKAIDSMLQKLEKCP